jgi:hypothetical protein
METEYFKVFLILVNISREESTLGKLRHGYFLVRFEYRIEILLMDRIRPLIQPLTLFCLLAQIQTHLRKKPR